MKTLILLTTLLLTACTGETTEINVTIIEIQKESTEWGCIGTNYKTIIKDSQNRVGSLCGKWGEVGATILVKRTTGHWDSSKNGVRLR